MPSAGWRIANLSGSNPQYLYFDVNSWERRLFNGNIQNITNGFLSEEDVRVKFPSS
jgi:CCR4-NOT transcription complex subunit 2